MAFNTIYKHLAESIQSARKQVTEVSAKSSLDEMRAADRMLDLLATEFAEKMEPRQPGSFDKVKFLELAGVKEIG